MKHFLPATLIALALAGCGSEDQATTESARNFSGEEQKVAQVVEDYETASTSTTDPARVCDLLEVSGTASGRRRCERPLRPGSPTRERAIRSARGYALTVKKVKIDTAVSDDERKDGIDAVAEVTLMVRGDGKTRTEPAFLVRLDGRWLISGFGLH